MGSNPGANINDPADDRALRLPDIQDFNVQVRAEPEAAHRPAAGLLRRRAQRLALRTATSLGQEDGRDFGVIRDRMDPFRIRLGLNYRY